jgi:hypothetical protein
LPETQTSAKRGAIPTIKEEEATAERPIDPLPAPTVGTRGAKEFGA